MSQIPRLKRGDKICVTWIDSFTPNHSDWMAEADLDEHMGTGVTIETLGTYVRHDKKWLHLCASVAYIEGEESGYLNPLTIPVGCIEKVKKL